MANIKNLDPSNPHKGINISLPTKGSTNWSEDFENYFALKIRDHDHSGSGKGALLNATTLSVGTISNIEASSITLEGGATNQPVGSDSTVFELETGETKVIEYALQDLTTGDFRGGQLSIIKYSLLTVATVDIADEYMGNDLNIDFSLTTGGNLKYTNSGSTQYRFRYFIRKVTIGEV